MTVAFGNLIVVIIAEGKFLDNQVYEYFLFAGLLGVATIIFCVLSYFYKYQETHHDDEKRSDTDVENNDGTINKAYSQNSIDNDIKMLKMKALDPN